MDDKVPGEVSLKELKELAAAAGEPCPYYIVNDTTGGLPIAKLYAAADGGLLKDGWRVVGKSPNTIRFTNYWHAYAYRLKLLSETLRESKEK
jgi:hypothetical protein